MLACPHAAEDAAQDALIRAWRAHDSCTGRPSAWVATIAKREALRQAGKARALPVAEVPERPADVLPADTLTDRVWVHRGLARLNDADRAMLQLCYGADLTAKQAAGATGSTEATVRVRLHRARKRLGAILKEE